jgi:hypothetical protein
MSHIDPLTRGGGFDGLLRVSLFSVEDNLDPMQRKKDKDKIRVLNIQTYLNFIDRQFSNFLAS